MGWDREGVLAGRYRRLDRIGQGGMGAVWRAHDADLDREVAVKELRVPEQVAEDERAVWYARMEREARAAARLRHPGIVTVHDRVVGEDGRPWIVMELVRGRSLDRVLAEQGALPARRVAAIGLAMLDALSAAHANGIVHRDVKPANVLLEDERVLLTDFGIAAVEGDATLTRSGAVLGTPAYMSPEQVEGRSVAPASDLWSLGATLYAAVEGRPPFTAPAHGGLFVAIATRDPAPPRCGGPLAEVLRGLLTKDPADRPSPEHVRELLIAAAKGLAGRSATVAGPPRSATLVDSMAGAAVIGRDQAVAVRGALACIWITVAFTMLLGAGDDFPLLTQIEHWVPVGLVLAVILSIGLWSLTHRPVLALVAVAVINVWVTVGALLANHALGNEMQADADATFSWLAGAFAMMFAFAGANRVLAARIPSVGSRQALLSVVVVLEGLVMTLWPWAVAGLGGMQLHPPDHGRSEEFFVSALGIMLLAWIAAQAVLRPARAGLDPGR